MFLLTAGSQQKSAINTERVLLSLWLGVLSVDSVQSFPMLRCEKRKCEGAEISTKGHVKKRGSLCPPRITFLKIALGLLKLINFAKRKFTLTVKRNCTDLERTVMRP